MTCVLRVLDRVLDADSHDMAPLQYWGPIWGPAAGQIAEQVTESLRAQIGNDFYAPEHKGDATAIDHDSAWKLKETSAPGAFDFSERLDVVNERASRASSSPRVSVGYWRAIAMFSLSCGLIRWSWLQRMPTPRVGICT
jgi:hypothetical protein